MSDSDRKAREYAMTLLSRRAYTEQGLYDKISGRFDEQDAASAVARMLELGLLDDEDYARRYASDCVKLKGMSQRRTAMELMRKGIDKELAEAVAEECGGDPEPRIAAVIKRRYPRCFEDERNRNKTVNALLRLGYRYGDIAGVLRNLDEDDEYYDDWEQDNE